MSEAADRLFQQVRELSRSWKGNVLELGQTLSALRNECPEQFAAWLIEPGVSRRRTCYLIEIAEAYEKLPVDRERLQRLGWTKLKEMAPLIGMENAGELIEVAERSTVIQLRQHLLGKHDADTIKTLMLHLTHEQHQELSEAVILSGSKQTRRGLTVKEEAIIELTRSSLMIEKATTRR